MLIECRACARHE
ncbi:BgTH12-03877 [Blumeria graminis f. sp. triticale]|uniref:BgTH12-03877 n=1 Tax=Blumeria graminis f. sp. triticale TaxID=1689686 RepID=A0A9W4DDE0_BLUGR|nr:BgTH12-03877 [Blumeria graminis f. sp. triticale]